MRLYQTFLSLAVTCTFGLLVAGSGQAAIFSASTTAPTVDGADISQFTGMNAGTFDVGKWYLDTQDPGQTFTTGSSASYLNAFTIFSNTGTSSPNMGLTLRVSTISGSTLTPIASETLTWTTPTAANSYLTFAFDTPVLLGANTLYAVDVTMNSAGGFSGNLPYIAWAPSDLYNGGSYYIVNNGSTTVTLNSGRDRHFHLDLEAVADVPEPSTYLVFGGLALCFGLAGWWRKRRQAA